MVIWISNCKSNVNMHAIYKFRYIQLQSIFHMFRLLEKERYITANQSHWHDMEKSEVQEEMYQKVNPVDLVKDCWDPSRFSTVLEWTSLSNLADSSWYIWISDGRACLIAAFKWRIVTSSASRLSWLQSNVISAMVKMVQINTMNSHT